MADSKWRINIYNLVDTFISNDQLDFAINNLINNWKMDTDKIKEQKNSTATELLSKRKRQISLIAEFKWIELFHWFSICRSWMVETIHFGYNFMYRMCFKLLYSSRVGTHDSWTEIYINFSSIFQFNVLFYFSCFFFSARNLTNCLSVLLFIDEVFFFLFFICEKNDN